MKIIRGRGIEINEQDGYPLIFENYHYWDAQFANILIDHLGEYFPVAEYKETNAEEKSYTALFSLISPNGKELCGRSRSLEDGVKLPEEDVKRFIDDLEQLHKICDDENVPQDIRDFLRYLKVPDPKEMPRAWRVNNTGFLGLKRKLCVLWGYETKPEASILPLTSTSAKWSDNGERSNLALDLNYVTIDSNINWTKLFGYIVLIISVLFLLWILISKGCNGCNNSQFPCSCNDKNTEKCNCHCEDCSRTSSPCNCVSAKNTEATKGDAPQKNIPEVGKGDEKQSDQTGQISPADVGNINGRDNEYKRQPKDIIKIPQNPNIIEPTKDVPPRVTPGVGKGDEKQSDQTGGEDKIGIMQPKDNGKVPQKNDVAKTTAADAPQKNIPEVGKGDEKQSDQTGQISPADVGGINRRDEAKERQLKDDVKDPQNSNNVESAKDVPLRFIPEVGKGDEKQSGQTGQISPADIDGINRKDEEKERQLKDRSEIEPSELPQMDVTIPIVEVTGTVGRPIELNAKVDFKIESANMVTFTQNAHISFRLIPIGEIPPIIDKELKNADILWQIDQGSIKKQLKYGHVYDVPITSINKGDHIVSAEIKVKGKILTTKHASFTFQEKIK